MYGIIPHRYLTILSTFWFAEECWERTYTVQHASEKDLTKLRPLCKPWTINTAVWIRADTDNIGEPIKKMFASCEKLLLQNHK